MKTSFLMSALLGVFLFGCKKTDVNVDKKILGDWIEVPPPHSSIKFKDNVVWSFTKSNLTIFENDSLRHNSLYQARRDSLIFESPLKFNGFINYPLIYSLNSDTLILNHGIFSLMAIPPIYLKRYHENSSH